MAPLKDRIKSFINRHFRKHPKQEPLQTQDSAARPPEYFQPGTEQQKQIQQQKNRPYSVNRVAANSDAKAATTTGALTIALENQSSSGDVYAYISRPVPPMCSLVQTLTDLP